jgi:putative transposase
MPSRNILRQFVPDAYYHVYNRGVSRQTIFHEAEDYAVFLNLLKRYLDVEPIRDLKGREYSSLRGEVELLAYCLMPNHFHLLFYLHEPDAITRLMRAVTGAYTIFYNKKYKRIGPLFQSRFKASHILDEAYLLHISRYIHMNPKDYKRAEYSSVHDYVGGRSTTWLQPERVMALFEGDLRKYEKFLEDYEDWKKALEIVKAELA